MKGIHFTIALSNAFLISDNWVTLTCKELALKVWLLLGTSLSKEWFLQVLFSGVLVRR